MKKVTIIYWSAGGNVEVLAEHMAKGAKAAGAEVTIKLVQQATLEDVLEADAIAFGSPSMDNNNVEQQEMKPFIDEFKLRPVGNKKTILFGSYGWDEGEFMKKWIKIMEDYEFNVIDHLVVKEAPDEAQLAKVEELGRKLAE